ncbi:MAG: hypothetical protein ACAI38_16325 [Myxococcota bacterium]|nr:hypothetical protein [Myxococcota bacterium]
MNTQLSQREVEALDACARLIHARRLTTPALLLLGAVRPVQRITDASLRMAMPYIEALAPTDTVRALHDLLNRPNGAQLLCDLLSQRLGVLDRA